MLWALSSGFVFHVCGPRFRDSRLHGLGGDPLCRLGSWLSWLVGRPLIRLNGDRYAREAELRFSLMRVNEHVDAISLAGGEADEKRRLELDLGTVLAASRRIISAQIRLTWVTAGYGWITVVAPILIASPVYFAGDISFGGLMMAVGALQSGAFLAALVRRQYRRHRRLARHAAARRRLPSGADPGRVKGWYRARPHAPIGTFNCWPTKLIGIADHQRVGAHDAREQGGIAIMLA